MSMGTIRTGGLTGGMLAPDPEPAAVTGASQAGDPLANLVAGFQRWAQLHHGRTDPLRELAQGHRTTRGQLAGLAGPAVQQITRPDAQGLEQVGRVNQTGNERAGMAFQEYDLGHGRVAHVYFDPKTGRRQVIQFTRQT